jgi:hypothetical protein
MVRTSLTGVARCCLGIRRAVSPNEIGAWVDRLAMT